MDLSGHSSPDYDLCIVANFPEKDPHCVSDSEASSDSSSEEIVSDGSNPLQSRRFSFWNTGCHSIVDRYRSYDITPIDRIGSENVSMAEDGSASEITAEQTARLSRWNTSCTLQKNHSRNNTNKDFRTALSRKFEHHYMKHTKKSKSMVSRSAISARIPNIISDLGNRQMHGTSSNYIPADVFARMKLFPTRFTHPVTRITCVLIDHKCEHVIVATEFNKIQVWNLKTFKYSVLKTPLQMYESVVQMLLNPDGQILVAGTRKPGKIIAYDWATKKMFFNFWIYKRSEIVLMKFSPHILDGVSWLCTMSNNRKIALWPFVESKNCDTNRYYVAGMENHSVTRIENNINPNYLGFQMENNIYPNYLGFQTEPNSLPLHRLGYLGTNDPILRPRRRHFDRMVRNVNRNNLVWPFGTDMRPVDIVNNFNIDNVPWPCRNDVRVIELDEMKNHSYPNGEIFYSGHQTCTAISGIWERNEIFMSTKVVSFDFSPLGKYVVFAREDNTLQSYALHMPDNIPRVSYKGPSGQKNIIHIKWANTKRALISCQLRGCAVYRDTRKMTRRNLEMHENKPDWPCMAEWSCDDQWIFTIGHSYTVYIWRSDNLTVHHRVEARERIRSLQPNPIHPHILNVLFLYRGMELWNVGDSPNNRYLDTFDVDSTFMANPQFCWAEWSKDGTMLAALNFKRNLSLYSLYQGIERVG